MSEPPSQDSPEREPHADAFTSSPPTETAGDRSPEPARLPKTRTGSAHAGLIAGVIVLVLLLVFILENTQSVKISYFGASGHLALGVALLLAAVGGALLVGIVGTARIAQVKRHAKGRPR